MSYWERRVPTATDTNEGNSGEKTGESCMHYI